ESWLGAGCKLVGRDHRGRDVGAARGLVHARVAAILRRFQPAIAEIVKNLGPLRRAWVRDGFDQERNRRHGRVVEGALVIDRAPETIPTSIARCLICRDHVVQDRRHVARPAISVRNAAPIDAKELLPHCMSLPIGAYRFGLFATIFWVMTMT